MSYFMAKYFDVALVQWKIHFQHADLIRFY